MQRKTVAVVDYDTDLMVRDMTERGWLKRDLARVAAVSDMTVGRFLRAEQQTARTAERLARALGRSVKRYMRPQQAAS